MADTKYEKVWVQNIKGMLRGVQFTDEMKAACLREFEAFLSEAEKRKMEERAKALEEAASTHESRVTEIRNDPASYKNGKITKSAKRASDFHERSAQVILALQAEER